MWALKADLNCLKSSFLFRGSLKSELLILKSLLKTVIDFFVESTNSFKLSLGKLEYPISLYSLTTPFILKLKLLESTDPTLVKLSSPKDLGVAPLAANSCVG